MIKGKSFLIVGLGLLGGSIAKGLKKWNHKIYAIDIDPETIRYALENGIIDEGGTACDSQLIGKADVIISGLYPTLIVDWIAENQKYFKSGALVTDVTGVKGAIVDRIQSILRPDCEFIGVHPMAGKEVSGVQYADPAIFLPANLIITPTEKNTQQAIDFICEMGKELRFDNICQLSVAEHDRMIGYLSQLTHVIAVSLMNANDSKDLVQYTGDSFRDLTRIAKINEHLWTELFLLNKENLVQQIDDFVEEISDFRNALQSEDTEKMKQKFITSTQRRKYFDR
ncbi:MAG: prephenate dehydrogenase [Oscillospiraceae bacterium]|nr:prephenate dehydrogenase [Oscillospiraceae bacterium]